jgi:hypothetical protein
VFAALGIILIVAGAVVAFGVDTAVDGVDLETIGYVMMAGGALALVVAAIQAAGVMFKGNKTMRAERHVSPDGRHVVDETEVR